MAGAFGTIGQVLIGGSGALQAYNLSGQDPNSSGIGRAYMGDFVYPSDLVNNNLGRTAYMSIRFSEYERRSIFNQAFKRPIGGITLPIPSSLADSTSVNWNPSSQSPMNAAVGAAAEQYLSGGNKQGSAASGSFMDSVMSNVSSGGKIAGVAIEAAGANMLSNAFGGAGAQVLQMAGLAANPFMTMLFQNPNFKTHAFSWSFAPKNAQESIAIASIINAFKYNMLPGLAGGSSGGGVFFTYPNIANISLFPSNAFLYKFKPCAVKSFTADLAPNGPSFFKDTYAPTHINLSVEMVEIEYWTKETVVSQGFSSAGSSNYQNALLGYAAQGAEKLYDGVKSLFD